MTISPTQQRVLDWLISHGPAGSSAIAKEHGFGKATARTHLHRLRQAGLVHPSGLGSGSTWHAIRDYDTTTMSRRNIAERTDKPTAMWQCPSVWVYASRVAAQARQAQPRPGL